MANGAHGEYAAYNNITQYQSQNLYEGAIGYFTKHKSKSIHFELFLGYGVGADRYRDNTDVKGVTKKDHSQEGKYERYIFQPTIGFGLPHKNRVDLAFTPRVSLVNFSELTTINYSENPVTTVVVDPAPAIFFEPTATAKINLLNNRVFFTVQIGMCLSNRGEADGFVGPVITFSGGLGFRLGGLTWNKQE